MQTVQENAVGKPIRAIIRDPSGTPVDVSAATVTFVFQSARTGVDMVKATTPTGTPGQVLYTTVAGDLTPSGEWSVQAHYVTASIDDHTDIQSFQVAPNL